MQFLFNLFNHTPLGQRSLEDPMSIIGHQLQALGHRVVWETANNNFLMPDSGINIVIEGFVPVSTEIISKAFALGCRFLCIATEEPTPKGFNHGRDREMVKRQAEFTNTAKFFEGILHLVPGKHVTDWYGQFAPSAPIELGWAPTLPRAGDMTEPIFDFGFFGSVSNRRLRILKQLAKVIGTKNAVRVEGTFTSQTERDRIMREAKVIVQIRKHEEMGLVSSSRCNTALCLGRPVLAEPHLLAKPWDEVIKFSQTSESFFNDAIMMRSAWRGVHSSQFAKFRDKFQPERCIGQPLRDIKLDLETIKAVA